MKNDTNSIIKLLPRYVEFWKEKFALYDWEVSIKTISDKEKIKDCKSKTAYVQFFPEHRKAQIHIFEGRLKEKNDSRYWKVVICHEMLHLFFAKLHTDIRAILEDNIVDKTERKLAEKRLLSSVEPNIVWLSNLLVKGEKKDGMSDLWF